MHGVDWKECRDPTTAYSLDMRDYSSMKLMSEIESLPSQR